MGSPWVTPRYLLNGGWGTVSLVPINHGNPDQVRPEKPERPEAYPVRRDYFETLFPVQGVVRLLEVHEYLVEDILPHVLILVYQLVLPVIGHHPVALLKPMENYQISNVPEAKILWENKGSRMHGWNK